MAKDWDYAQMAHTASLAGGPEKWVELMKNEEFAKGASEMKGKMAPWIFIATGFGVAGTLLFQKAHKWFVDRKEKRQCSAETAAEAEAMLISRLKEDEAVKDSEELDCTEEQ